MRRDTNNDPFRRTTLRPSRTPTSPKPSKRTPQARLEDELAASGRRQQAFERYLQALGT